jgi:REP element-mobilizing transposase RayT
MHDSTTMPLAYLITFTTYGTWLHGTDKGLGSVDRDHNIFGTPFVAPDVIRKQRAADLMTGPPFTLGPPDRDIVRDAIVALCKEKSWRLRALHVRTNHIHAVVSADRDPGRIMSDFKARASRELNRLHPNDDPPQRWTRHGSTPHLFDDAAVARAIAYVLDGQGTPMAIYDGRQINNKEPRTK